MAKKISEMGKEELLIFINDKFASSKEYLKKYNDYFNIKIVNNEQIFKKDNIILDDLKLCAYSIKEIFEHIEWAYNKQLINDSVKTSKNIIPKRGEIWTCQLGKNIGSEENKIRPVIIIQNDTGNEKSPTTIVVPISNRPKKISVHVVLKDTDYVLVEGETEKITGTILCEQIKVISKVRLGRHVGTLTDKFIDDILNLKLKNSIHLKNFKKV